MKPKAATVLAMFATLGAVIATPASATEPGPAPIRTDSQGSVIPGRYIVVFKDTVGNPANLARAQTEARSRSKLGFVYRHALKGYSAVLPKNAVEGLRRDPRVDFVAPDREVEAFAQAIPTGIDRTFATANANLDIDEDDDRRVDVDVAVIDTGTDYDHPDLDVVARTDCSNGTEAEATCEDESAAGIDWVTATREDEDPENDIEVANMSLGCGCALSATNAAIEGSVEQGVVHVVAAGNSGSNTEFFDPQVVSIDVISLCGRP